MDKNEVLRKLEETESALRKLILLNPEVLKRSYGPGKWNGVQIINHIADADLNLLSRFLKAIAEEGAPVIPFDQNRWAEELKIGERPFCLSIKMIEAACALFRYYILNLPDEVLSRHVMHPIAGAQPALGIALHAANHAAHHLEQIDAIVEGREWVKR